MKNHLHITKDRNRLRVAGKRIALSSPGLDGKFKLAISQSQTDKTVHLELDDETLNELEDLIGLMRVEQPDFERSRTSAPMVMKKFMLDNSVFPKWPAREMAAVYRGEGTYLTPDDIWEWREALDPSGQAQKLRAKLILSSTRHEITKFRKIIIDGVAERVKAHMSKGHADADLAVLADEVERQLRHAYPGDQLDEDGMLSEARAMAHSEILLPEAPVRPVDIDAIAGAFSRELENRARSRLTLVKKATSLTAR